MKKVTHATSRIVQRLTTHFTPLLWQQTNPIRAELLSVERLESQAKTLAATHHLQDPLQPITGWLTPCDNPLQQRLQVNASVLLAAYRRSAAELITGHNMVPAAEWLLDNYHIVEQQISEIRADLPSGYYRQLPKLAEGPFQGYPRVLSLAWTYIAHTDSHFDPDIFSRFLQAYQDTHPLSIGELWAVAITLRSVLIENLRRLTDEISLGLAERAAADELADKLLQPATADSVLLGGLSEWHHAILNEDFTAQLIKRLRDHDPFTTPALQWLEQRLQLQTTDADEVVLRVIQRQAASNVSVRNVITSLRTISAINWAELFEKVSLVDACLNAGSPFSEMDFVSRNLYRNAIEQLARRATCSEQHVAEQVLLFASKATVDDTGVQAVRERDPGYYLIGNGRLAFEKHLGCKTPLGLRLRQLISQYGIQGYRSIFWFLTASWLGLAAFLLNTTTPFAVILLVLVGILPATELANALMHRLASWLYPPTLLPALALKQGVPLSLRTLLVVPTLIADQHDVAQQLARLEIHYLAAGTGEIYFALLSDFTDAEQATLPTDQALLHTACLGIAALNQRYSLAGSPPRFYLLHRPRLFNQAEQKWIGWERKRGKLMQLNQCLRGQGQQHFLSASPELPLLSCEVPAAVRYVITLDADTQLPRDTALRLIGKLAHPLNQAHYDSQQQRVIAGYGILQPRVTPALAYGTQGSRYQRLTSGPAGIDPYAAAISDLYQDWFSEGSYTGKGIYDVDVFTASLAGRIPDNTILSHDLFEGCFARTGLVSDIEVIEDFPTRYDNAVQRTHRWTRGDWQLLPWLLQRQTSHNVSPLGRSKMRDNLRRSLLAPAFLLALFVAMLLPATTALTAVILLLAGLLLPVLLPQHLKFWPNMRPLPYSAIAWPQHLTHLHRVLTQKIGYTLLTLSLLADQAWRMLHAIGQTLWRLSVSHQHMLQWMSAAHVANHKRATLLGFYRQMRPVLCLLLPLCLVVIGQAPHNLFLLIPFLGLWLLAPALVYWLSLPTALHQVAALTVTQKQALRLIARRTWRFFERFVSMDDNMLPPDNVQFAPHTKIAHRTSPTNIGVYLLSTVTARDFGWIGTLATVTRLESCMATLQLLSRYRGHFYNWYDTQTLLALNPAYVSSVDSGNLAGHLIALANACDEWQQQRIAPHVLQGITDNLELATLALSTLPAHTALSTHLNDMALLLEQAKTLTPCLDRLMHLSHSALALSGQYDVVSTQPVETPQTLYFYLQAINIVLAEHAADEQATFVEQQQLQQRLGALAWHARALAMAMDFGFLLNTERNLLSIGFNLADNQLDNSCYDLLASEARLASLFAIAKGDVSNKHWFRLGRIATPIGKGAALLSWSGSMFEYLMPSLVMRAPGNSLLEQSNRLIVTQQIRYAKQLQVPWGISESAYNARDLALNYQYSNFGIPGLGLKRGLAQNVVIAPYATALAAMVDAPAAYTNFERLQELGALSMYGFLEAIDYTRARLPDQSGPVLIQSVMAHHQGMTLIALANTLQQGLMRSRFHREPIIQACELLLQERQPQNVVHAPPKAEEVHIASSVMNTEPLTERHLNPSASGAPLAHILSNGRYSVMLTATGGGYSHYCGLAISRWREDSSCDPWGSYILLRDCVSGARWSPTLQPLDLTKNIPVNHHYSAVFSEDHAEFSLRQPDLTTTLDILISSEHDGEVRRITLSNHSPLEREIELTSYSELVLNTASSDNAHPAFSKLFVQTEYVDAYHAILATRRLRSAAEKPLWLAHFAVIEDTLGDNTPYIAQYETNRALFFGVGTSLSQADAMTSNKSMTNSNGTVLDPIISLRHRVKLAPGKWLRVAFWTLVGHSRAEVLHLVEQHNERSAYGRAAMLAWTQAQVQLRHLAVNVAEAADFQRLTGPLLYNDQRFRAPAAAILRGAGAQSGLWQHSISGDLPVVLLHIDDIQDIDTVQQLLRAHEYWRMKQLAVDLVIINERATSYMQQLHSAIETLIRSSQSKLGASLPLAAGSVYLVRADLMTVANRALLAAVARVVLYARRGMLNRQLDRMIITTAPSVWHPGQRKKYPPVLSDMSEHHRTRYKADELEFFNGLGGFACEGREYSILLKAGQRTPMPWLNVIANPHFGFQVSASGAGYSWAQSSRENQLTAWSNDPILDPCSEVMYLRDEEQGHLFCSTAAPLNDGGHYQATHGFGYSHFQHQAHGIALSLLQYVPVDDPIKISRLCVHNQSNKSRTFTLTAYTEWVLGRERGATSPYLLSSFDADSEVLLVSNPWQTALPGRVAFAALGAELAGWTADRTEFIGRNRSVQSPLALLRGAPLQANSRAGCDPCAALQQRITLAPGERIEMLFLLGQADNAAAALAMVARYRQTNLSTVLQRVKAFWQEKLGAVHVSTPDRSMDIMLNGWLLYQTISCRLFARAAFYQASGAYGFRDQLQDGMALSFADPSRQRHHLLRAAARQFVEGDVQHWWLPHSGQGVRSRISDDRVWLAYAAARYIESSGDQAVLEEPISFLQGPVLDASQHDAFFQPMPTDCKASLFEHCARGLDQAITLTGSLGLPLIGSGDWNDGMDQVGAKGQGESVWLGWFIWRTLALFIPLAIKYDPTRVAPWQTYSLRLQTALETQAWDGEWYKRATYDDGSWLGSRDSDECQIDSIAQSWSVLSSAANPARARQAMAAVTKRLVKPDAQLLLLFTPPFVNSARNPGYIKGYPAGIRENGGQYSHAAMWVILAYAKLQQGDNAHRLFNMVNPINHALSPSSVQRYKVEPYVVAADIYAEAPHIGRGGWSWYTGAAGWMYQAGLEGILGLTRHGNVIQLSPCLPSHWPGFKATVTVGQSQYHLSLLHRQTTPTAATAAYLDDVIVPATSALFLTPHCLQLPLDNQQHRLEWRLP